MIRLPRDMSADDVVQWLHDGLYLVRTRRGTKVEWVPAKWGGTDRGAVLSSTRDGRVLRTVHTSCAAHWPELGAFNHPDKYAVHFERTVDRQYRRTFNPRCVRVVVPWEFRVARTLGLRQVGAWANVCWLPWFPQPYPSLDEAMSLLDTGIPTVAVNRRLIVAGNGSKRLFYLDGMMCANAIGGKLIYTCPPALCGSLEKMLGGRYDAL